MTRKGILLLLLVEGAGLAMMGAIDWRDVGSMMVCGGGALLMHWTWGPNS